MSLKHILLELKQWFEMKMKNKKSRLKFIAGTCAVIVFLIVAQTINGLIMQKQFGDMESSGYSSKEANPSSETWRKDWPDHSFQTAPKGWPGYSPDFSEKKTSGTETDGKAAGMQEPYMKMQPTPLMSAIILCSVLAVAIITSMILYIRYRKNHVDGIPPLTILGGKER